jgi:hypothetical protein
VPIRNLNLGFREFEGVDRALCQLPCHGSLFVMYCFFRLNAHLRGSMASYDGLDPGLEGNLPNQGSAESISVGVFYY